MSEEQTPTAVVAEEAPARRRPSVYPEPFADAVRGRRKHPLGDLFGLRSFGVNLTRLAPGAATALRHAHSRQDEFVYVLRGEPTLITERGERTLAAGMCAGFRAGSGDAHHLVNRSREEVVLLEIGDRSPGDSITYPDDDLEAVLADGGWRFTRKNGTPY